MTYVETIQGHPFIDAKRAGEAICKGDTYTRGIIRELETGIVDGVEIKEIRERYSRYAVRRDGSKVLLVNYFVLVDYIGIRSMLKDKNARKYVPPFEPDVLSREMGFGSKIVKVAV
jgi:hypothetical protein